MRVLNSSAHLTQKKVGHKEGFVELGPNVCTEVLQSAAGAGGWGGFSKTGAETNDVIVEWDATRDERRPLPFPLTGNDAVMALTGGVYELACAWSIQKPSTFAGTNVTERGSCG
jgi:hypothetical protein